MTKQKIILALVIMLMFTPLASASIIDDIDNAISSGIKQIVDNVKTLSLPGVGSITIKCDSGASCGQSGENWLITMNSMSTAQTIDLQLPAGTKYISGDMEVTTQGTVTIEVKEKAPVQTVPVIQNQNYKYLLRDGTLGTMNNYIVLAYERSGISSIISTNYDVQLLAPKGNSQVVSKSYDYRSPQQINLYDGAGNMATITPSHQISGGLVTDVGSVLFVDNGYGTWEAFDKSNFQYYLNKVRDEVQYVAPWNIGSLPSNWAQFLARMKSLGLNQFTDLPLSKNGNNIIMTYPTGSIGTQLQATIPKEMALSITVKQHWGEPVIDSVTLSPETIIKGQGFSTLTAKVTNKGTTDTISVSAIVNGATVTNVVNSLTLSQGQQGTFTFSLNPTVSSASDLGITVTATAGGSGIQSKKGVILHVQDPPEECPWYNPLCKDPNQKVSVTAYNPSGSILTNAPILKNGVQIGTGQWEGVLPFGKYTFSTNNVSNPAMYAPTATDVELSGGEPKTVSFRFTAVPQDTPQDYTWIFWVLLFAVVGGFAYFYGWYRLPWFWIGLVVVWLLYNLIQILLGIQSDIDEIISWF